jgi:predicted Zn-dependent peptidase
MIVREVLDSGVRLLTESMPQVRSVSIGVWLTRGSRHEPEEHAGIAHFVEHMLFKGTATRSAEDIAQEIDSVGGQLDAFTSKEYAGYYIKVIDEHLPRAVDILSDVVLHPALAADDVEREKKVILEEIKMVEDTPDDLVHELFTASYWNGHPLGRPILGTAESVEALTPGVLRDYFERVYTPDHFVVSTAGNLEHALVRELVERAFPAGAPAADAAAERPPRPVPGLGVRTKDLEQSHVCLGTTAHSQGDDDRYIGYVLNTLLGGSMSSRLFQNVRERRGLAYAIFSGLSAYRDTGLLTIYAGCATESVEQVIDLVVDEIRALERSPVAEGELRRAKDHLKGSLMLGLENTASRMSQLGRQEIYLDRQFGLDQTLAGIERVSAGDLQRVAAGLFGADGLSATVLGPLDGWQYPAERLRPGR